jgi:hypothetical protein
MPATHEITAFDKVELTEAINSAPAGACGTVLDLLDNEAAIVEISNMPLEPILDRLVFAPIDKLRLIPAAPGKSHGVAA